MSKNEKFAALLNRYLEENDRSASWLAQHVGVNPSTVSRWINGETRPTDAETVRRIADAFKVRARTEIETLALAVDLVYQENGVYVVSKEREDQPTEVFDKPLREMLYNTILQAVNAAPAQLADLLYKQFHLYDLERATSGLHLYPSSSGDKGIDLAHRRLFISNAFGSYFTGLLERDNIYTEISGQIDSPVVFKQQALAPLSRILWALQHPQGPRVIVIAAEGGMGKSTLAAKLVRSLFEEQLIDVILGDSAKTERVNPVSGEIIAVAPGYYDWQSCCRRLYDQLGLPDQIGQFSERIAVHHIRNRLIARKAVIVVDNLESVSKGSELLEFLRSLASRDIRIVVTTRTVQEIHSFVYKTMVVHLKPISTSDECLKFVLWHIEHFQEEYPDLRRLTMKSVGEEKIQDLLNRTGGVPLLLQLVISTVARSSWTYLDGLPTLFGIKLLNFLYYERWQELERAGSTGRFSQKLLQFVTRNQYQGKLVTSEMLEKWSIEERAENELQSALYLLYERFLIINHNLDTGNFTIFPSLAEFLAQVSFAN